MPWFFNANSMVVRAKVADGTSFGFPPRKLVFLKDELMSPEVKSLMDAKVIRCRGDGKSQAVTPSSYVDMVTLIAEEPVAAVAEVVPIVFVTEVVTAKVGSEPDTSNNIHDIRDTLAAIPELSLVSKKSTKSVSDTKLHLVAEDDSVPLDDGQPSGPKTNKKK